MLVKMSVEPSFLFLIITNLIIYVVKSEQFTFRNVTLLKSYREVLKIIENSNSLKENLPGENLQYLYVVGDIPVLRKNSVSDIKTVQDLEFVENNLQKIEPGAFKKLTSVKKLVVNFNDLSTLEYRVFENLPVEHLEVCYNQLTKIYKGSFRNLPRLNYLRLEHNKIRTLEDGVFDDIPTLNILDLASNQISSLPNGFFRNLPNLRALIMSNNNFGKLKVEIFEKSLITYLDLSQNRISSLDENFFVNLPLLKGIILNNNHLKTIQKGVFNNQNLDQIEIQHNEISFIDPGAFDNMPVLANIKLGGNKLTKYDSRWFHNTPNIFRLFLTSNQIEEIPAEAFKNIYNNKGQWIKLDYNKIRKISPAAFKGFGKIHYLNLVSNNIDSWNEKLLEDVEFVGYLNLQNNNIHCPEGDFDKIFKANFTYLGFNKLSIECVTRINEWASTNPYKIVCTDSCSKY